LNQFVSQHGIVKLRRRKFLHLCRYFKKRIWKKFLWLTVNTKQSWPPRTTPPNQNFLWGENQTWLFWNKKTHPSSPLPGNTGRI